MATVQTNGHDTHGAAHSAAHATHDSHGGHTAHGAHGEVHHPSTYQLLRKLFHLLRQEKRDVWVLVIYSIIAGLLGLVVPLSSQAIVNAVQLGVVTPQLVVLSIAVGLGMLFLGLFTVLESYIVDLLKQRLFVRAALDVATRLPRIRMDALDEYAPELVNRFFDVMTIQKSLTKLLIDGMSALLVALVGLILLAIYHPVFIIFDLVLFLFAAIVIFVLSYNGMETSIKESKKKYALVEWLEEIARSHASFKMYSTDEFIMRRVDKITTEYVIAHKKHFTVLARQLIGSAIFRAIASAGILGLGGFLVIEQSLSIGQLVAAELVILSVLNSLEKLISQFDMFYDLLTAVDKLSHITDKPLESRVGEQFERIYGPASLRFHNVHFDYPNGNAALHGTSFEIPARMNTSIIGSSGSGKTTITNLLARLYDAQSGSTLLNGQEIRHLCVDDVRSSIGIVTTSIEIFDGTVRDNILMGRQCTTEELTWALQTAQVYDEIITLSDGLNTSVEATGGNLSESLLCRVMIARAIVAKPQLLVLDEAFHTLDEALKLRILDAIYTCQYWTIVDVSNDTENIRRADYIIALRGGTVAEVGSPTTLADDSSSIFSTLFPNLTRGMRSLAA
jgi:ABC-type bacteriocin/lantibiotic exporter with double-glycine peptidase domain